MEMEQHLNDTFVTNFLQRSQNLFLGSNPYIPQSCNEARLLKENAKFSANFSQPADVKLNQTTSTGRSHKENVQLLTYQSPEAEHAARQETTEMRLVKRAEENANADKKSSSNRPTSTALATRTLENVPEPSWHAPWELSAVVSGHLGWVRSIAFDPSNEWFATGSADRTIKIWDLAKCCAGAEGGLKLTLTGHINAIRGLAVSDRHPYLFSAGEDKMVKCWDLEHNKVIRHYHGHLSGVYALKLHPTLDLLVTGGRDSVARVWDIRTKHEIHVLGGHSGAVGSILTNSVDPQIITGSHDATIRLWDLAAGKAMTTLTQHKKAIRALTSSLREFSFVSASADNMKKWQTRDGRFLKNLSGHNSVVNCLAANEDGVLVSGGDNGSLQFWDYDTGYCFQKTETIAQPGSLDAENGIFAMSFDMSGSRLVTCESDKSIKIWKENSEASEESHPVDMKTWTKQSLSLKRF